jgi:hypothetical protein
MTNPNLEASVKRLEEASLRHDEWWIADDDGVRAGAVVVHAEDLATLTTAYREQATLLDEAEAKLKANEWELADYAKTVGKLRDAGDVLTCPSCGYVTSHAERFR